jgi:predicted dehydrogenase
VQNIISNICIVGLGRQGNVHLEAAIKLKGMLIVEKVFAFDINGAYVDAMLEEFEFIKLNKLEHLPHGKNLYVLCAPSIEHIDIINKIRKFDKNSHILKEKPIKVEDGWSFDENIHVAQQRFFNPSYIFAKNYMHLIGNIKYFDYQYTLNDTIESWYWDNTRGGGCMLNVGWHFAFVMLWFLGEPTKFDVHKIRTNRKSFKYDTDDTVFIDVEYQDFFGKAYLSVADSSKRDSFRVIGDKGTMEVNKTGCVIFDTDGNVSKKEDGNELLSYMSQLCNAFYETSDKLDKLARINLKTMELIAGV